MGNLVIKTTLWPVCPLDIDSQGETEEAFNYIWDPLSEGRLLK
jgi:hypothetical protein